MTGRLQFSPARLKAARKRAGLSREWLAIQTKRTTGSIQNWESGRTTPDVDTLATVAAILECDLTDLFEPAEVTP